MLATKAVTLVCAAAVLLQTSGFVSAKHLPFFDKFAALAHMKYPSKTTTPSPAITDPITTIYIPTVIDTDNFETDPLTNPTIFSTATGTNAAITSPAYVSDTDAPPVTPADAAGADGADGGDGTDAGDGTDGGDGGIPVTRTHDALKSYFDDEDDETFQNDDMHLEETDLAEGRASSGQRKRLQVQQMKLRKQQSQKNKRRRQQPLKQNRRRQNAQNKRQQQRRRPTNKSQIQRNQVQRLMRIIKQLRLREQTQNHNRTPSWMRLQKLQYSQRYRIGDYE